MRQCDMKWRTGSYYHKGNSKLCFGRPEMIRASQNKLATRLKAREGFPPKSEIHDGRSATEKLNAYGRKQKKKKNRKYGQKAEN